MRNFGNKVVADPGRDRHARPTRTADELIDLGHSGFEALSRKELPIEYNWRPTSLPEVLTVAEIAARNMARWGTPAPSLAQQNEEDFSVLRLINKRNAEFYA